MLIQRRPPCSTTSTFGSALGSARTSPRERVERRSRGFGRFGMAASKRVVVDRRHYVVDSTSGTRSLDPSPTKWRGPPPDVEPGAARRSGPGHLVVSTSG